jgi:hypothetical protein
MSARTWLAVAFLSTAVVAACGKKDDGGSDSHAAVSGGSGGTGGATTGGTNAGGDSGEPGGAATGGTEAAAGDAGIAGTGEPGAGAPTAGGTEPGGTEAGGGDAGGAAGAGGEEIAGAPGAGGGETAGAGGGGASTAGAGGTGPAAGGAGGGVAVEIGTCEDFTACGGDVEGTWAYSAGCLDPAALGFDPSMLSTFCPTATYETDFTVTGTVTFTDGAVLRDGGWSAIVSLDVPASCTTAIGGCVGLGALIATATPESASSCSDTADGCACEVQMGQDGWSATSYTTDGEVITLSDGRTFDYCVSGTTLEYVETSDNPEPGTFQLTLE